MWTWNSNNDKKQKSSISHCLNQILNRWLIGTALLYIVNLFLPPCGAAVGVSHHHNRAWVMLNAFNTTHWDNTAFPSSYKRSMLEPHVRNWSVSSWTRTDRHSLQWKTECLSVWSCQRDTPPPPSNSHSLSLSFCPTGGGGGGLVTIPWLTPSTHPAHSLTHTYHTAQKHRLLLHRPTTMALRDSACLLLGLLLLCHTWGGEYFTNSIKRDRMCAINSAAAVAAHVVCLKMLIVCLQETWQSPQSQNCSECFPRDARNGNPFFLLALLFIFVHNW